MVSPVIIQTFGLMNSFQVNYMYLPFGPTAPSWPGLQYGLNFYDDSFTVLFRQAIAADPIAFAVWENSQPFRVLRAFYTGGYPLNLYARNEKSFFFFFLIYKLMKGVGPESAPEAALQPSRPGQHRVCCVR